MENYDIVVIGSGPAGLAAALAAYEEANRRILIIERDRELGGILQQCIHNGFGLFYFKEELTGPEYALRFIEGVKRRGIDYRLNTMALEIDVTKTITAVNQSEGVQKIKAKAIILCMGCRERSRGAINIPGMRPAGIFTAGTAQRFMNMEGYKPGREIVILGSGDIGLIMARRLTLEGATVKAVLEILPYSSGLTRNIVQCLVDFDIPLFFNHTITYIHGRDRVSGVSFAQVDQDRKPIPETEQYVSCDTLLLSVGLIPENELSKKAGIKLHPVTGGPVVDASMETSVPGIFACGNVVHVHDLVDNVSKESELAGRSAARYVEGKAGERDGEIKTIPGKGVAYVVPHSIKLENSEERVTIYLRVKDVYQNARLVAKAGESVIRSQRKRIMVPGEMQSLMLTKEELSRYEKSQCLTLEVIEEGVG